MAAHILIRETKPNREPPRLAWAVAAAAGLGLIAVVFSASGYRREVAAALHELTAWIDPGKSGDRAIRIKADARGHYRLHGRLNGVEVRFLVDTGATNVVLNRAAAQQLGFTQLKFDTPSSTANGIVLNARAKLKTLAIKSFIVRDFPVLVGGGELDELVLGMTWIHLFDSVEIKGGVMTLRY